MLSNHPLTSFPALCAFECLSGELLWGHLQCLMLGGASNLSSSVESSTTTTTHDSPQSKTTPLTGGTILQSQFHYRVLAKRGNWMVHRVLYKNETEENPVAAFIVHHESISAKELLSRCSEVGISHGQRHQDQEIVYVNRYDWAFHFGGPKVEEKIENHLKSLNPDFKFKPHPTYGEHDVNDELTGGRLNLLDASYWKDVEKHFALGHHPDLGQCSAFVDNTNGKAFGVHLSDIHTEYELGWMVFNKDQELVGFVYDSSYCALEGDNLVLEE
ncbi:hypothetical protein C9374_005542 [Naegleria lovaniensis]|uniref:Uncharacterized protein n=1 Tax=Naegleria lovaniensis TaxID=51637 RepID=A0AA88KK68_NAELO|nr:uncharacterized protein C9374_005542 [Naegleria lovaniensis]KAG2382340.1 hypothetical protein C9374_005542 [Naegleria lovaniensis]